MKYILTVLVTIFIFSGCTQKQVNLEDNTNKTIEITTNDDEESFDDEFEEVIIVYDPFEGYNRIMTSFNDGIYTYIFNPVSQGYAFILPESVRISVSNVFKNLFYPIRLSNNLLQGKLENSVEETGRFLVNSTLGLLGIFDVAKSGLGWEAHKEDFGQTLGFYGVPAGPHIVLPFFGPSNLRDTVGFVGDIYISPTTQTSALNYKIPDNATQGFILTSSYYINKNSLNLGKYENLKKDAIDFYTFLRDFYEEKRLQEIKEW